MTLAVSNASIVDARTGSEGRRIDLDEVCRYFTVGDTTVKALDQVSLHVDETAVERHSA